MIGPTFIHTTSSTTVFSLFLHDVADNLTQSQIEKLVIGTDEEISFRTAIKRCLPGSTHVLCTRHLKQNANRYMEDVVGFPLQDRKEVIDLLFCSNGIIQATDVDTHQHRVNRLRAVINEKESHAGEKKLLTYFNTRSNNTLLIH